MKQAPMAARRVEQHFEIEGKYVDWEFSPAAGMLRLTKHEGSFGPWWSGDFVDFRGIVSIAQESSWLRLDAIGPDGKCHTRTWGRPQNGKTRLGERTVIKLCRSFLSDLHGAPLRVVK